MSEEHGKLDGKDTPASETREVDGSNTFMCNRLFRQIARSAVPSYLLKPYEVGAADTLKQWGLIQESRFGWQLSQSGHALVQTIDDMRRCMERNFPNLESVNTIFERSYFSRDYIFTIHLVPTWSKGERLNVRFQHSDEILEEIGIIRLLEGAVIPQALRQWQKNTPPGEAGLE